MIRTTMYATESKTKVIILGSGTCAPHPTRGSPANYIALDDKHFMIDGGAGSLHALAKSGIDYAQLDGIFYTHFHPDHIGGLMPLLQALLWDPTLQRTKDFTFYGPEGLKKHIDGLRVLFQESTMPKTFNILIRELNDQDEIIFNKALVKAFYVPHTNHSLGYRFTSSDGKVITFSGDTGYGQEVVNLTRNADLAILECSWTEEYFDCFPSNNKLSRFVVKGITRFFNIKNKGHLTATLAGELAQLAGVKKLVLTHIYPNTDKIPLKERCAKVFKGKIVIASDFDIFDLSSS